MGVGVRSVLLFRSGGDLFREIRAFLGEGWEEYRQILREAMRGRIPLMDRVLQYVFRRRGKEIRPMFVLLVARLYGAISERASRSAALVELLHNATLIHDDVVDQAMFRRGWYTVRHLWGNRLAVLVGDFLLARGLLLAIESNAFSELQLLARAVRQMSEGELLQAEYTRHMRWTERVYLEVIRLKTASLLAITFALGALSQGASSSEVEDWYGIGERVGLAFQIRDDLLDFSRSSGKDLAKDLANGIFTLPVIYTLSQLPLHRKHEFLLWIRQLPSRRALKRVVETVRWAGGISYAERVAEGFLQEAMRALKRWEGERAHWYLERLIRFVVYRQY